MRTGTPWLGTFMVAPLLACAAPQAYPEVEIDHRGGDAEVDPEREAAGFATGSACAQEARRRYPRAPEKAWQLLAQCLRREDFTEIGLILRPPWSDELRTRGEEGLVALCHLIARRSGEIQVDLALAKDHGLQLGALSDLDGLPAGARGYALVRVRVAGTRDLLDGLGIVFAEQRLEAIRPDRRYAFRGSYLAYDSYYRPWQVYEFEGLRRAELTVPVDNGVIVEAQIKEKAHDFAADKLYYVLLRAKLRRDRVGEQAPYVGSIVARFEDPDFRALPKED